MFAFLKWWQMLQIWLFWMINLCRSMIYDSSLMSESSLEFPKWFCLVFDCGWQQNPRNVWKSYKRTSHSKTTQYLGTNPNFIYDSLERMNKTQSSSGYFNLKIIQNPFKSDSIWPAPTGGPNCGGLYDLLWEHKEMIRKLNEQ